MPSEQTEPTPADLRALMGEVDQLRARVGAMADRMRQHPDTTGAAYHLADHSGWFRYVHDALHRAADDIARTRAARDPKLCGVPWGVCPDHGNTLTSSGGRTWCTTPLCGRTWGYDRVDTPCPEPITHTVTDAHGGSFLACPGHAIAAKKQLDGGSVALLGPGDGVCG